MVSDYDIQALVDNELSWEEEKYIRALIKNDLNAFRRYQELKKQKIMLQEWYKGKG